VRVDGLEEPEGDPNVHCDDMQVAPREVAQAQRTAESAHGEDQGLRWVSVFGGEAERC